MNRNLLRECLKKWLSCLLCLSSVFFVQSVQAQEDILVPMSLLFRAESGVGNGYLISMGHTQDSAKTIYSGLYYSSETLTSSREVESLGIIAYNMSKLSSSNWGGEMTAALSRTEDKLYSRTGFDFSLTVYNQFMEGLSAFAGAKLRPTFLSFDWGNSELSELTTSIGLNYTLYKGINIYGQYKINKVFESDSQLMDVSDYGQFGLSVVF